MMGYQDVAYSSRLRSVVLVAQTGCLSLLLKALYCKAWPSGAIYTIESVPPIRKLTNLPHTTFNIIL
jgi:hypothetical protein